jgi:sugar lactone lactonase YvrE
MQTMRITFLILIGAALSQCCPKTNEKNPNRLELMFADDTYQLTGVAVSKTGRLFTNYPYWSDTYRYALVEIFPSYQVNPYPDITMNSWRPGDKGGNKWVCVQAVYIDDNNMMWVVDPAAPKMQEVYQGSYKLVKINPATNQVERIYPFTGISSQSYINDVRVDTQNGFAYLTNSKEGGIVVVNLQTGVVKQLLQHHYSVHSDSSYHFIIDGRELKKNGQVFKGQSDGIALTPNRQWLYYKPLTDDKLYRIQTAFLRDTTLSEETLGSKVEDLGHFTATDGMIFDKGGNLYLGDMQHYRIMKISPDLKMTELLQDDRLVWPDSYSISDDGYLYISCSEIHKQPEYNDGINKRTFPYAIYRVKLP